MLQQAFKDISVRQRVLADRKPLITQLEDPVENGEMDVSDSPKG